MPDGGLQRDATSQGIAEEVGLFESQGRNQCSDIVRHRLEGQRAIDVGGMAVSLQLDSNDASRRGKLCYQLSYRFNGPESTRKYHQRLPVAVELVVEIQTIDSCVAAPRVLVGGHGNHSLSSQFCEVVRLHDHTICNIHGQQ